MSERVYSRCRACRNDTLMINEGRLLCTWHACPDPTLIDRLGEPERTQTRAEAEIELLDFTFVGQVPAPSPNHIKPKEPWPRH